MPSIINTPLPVTTTGVTVTTTAETAMAVSSIVNTDPIESVVVCTVDVDITIGTGGLTLTVKIERGNVAGGILVGQASGPFTVVAGNRYEFGWVAVDRPGVVTNQQYVATVTIGSASGNSTVNTCVLQLQAQTPE